MYIETSAKDDVHVQDMFVQISKMLPQPSQAAQEPRGIYLSQPAGPQGGGAARACC